ncbi:MAG: bile acid:sodium symporter family protein [Verrucomicrobiales bacterium]
MQELLGIAIGSVVFLLMLAVGLDCTATGFRQCTSRPGLIATVTAVQFIGTPAVVLGMISLLGVAPATAAGLLLISACPSGSISNTYTFLARGNATLSVALTAISCLVAFVATPLVLFLLQSIVDEQLRGSLTLPWQPLAKQLVVSMALPVAIGLALRHRFSGMIERRLDFARLSSAVLVIALVVLIVVSNPAEMGRQLRQLWMPALAITTCLFAVAAVVALGFRLPKPERAAVFFELPCRNLAIAALIGLSVLERPELIYVATAFFLLEALLLLAVVGVISRGFRCGRHSGTEVGAGDHGS